jgi:hypothetical protein
MTLNPVPVYPSAGRYVLRLHRDAMQAGFLSGRIEHVSSGESGEFETREELVQWLAAHAATVARAGTNDLSPKDSQ